MKMTVLPRDVASFSLQVSYNQRANKECAKNYTETCLHTAFYFYNNGMSRHPKWACGIQR
jgi:hypothetical protein